MPTINDNLVRVYDRISRAAARAGREASSIQLIAVSKTKPLSMIEEARRAGVTDFGENRVQEALEKIRQDDGATWHLIGPLQRNKARFAVRIFDMIHSVDRLSLGQELDRRLQATGRTMPVLIQVNTSSEETKAGVEPDRALELAEQLSVLTGLAVRGLMTIPAFTPDPEDARPAFRLLRETRDRIASAGVEGVGMDVLSMGMSHDFEVAIEEGADMVRIGTAVFGARQA
ncbi:MAG: YggS family pyridoxal phosphate-dependent enzyme [Gemmatimonadetes bacterium]|nr:YggS family pyridoxal phosphate-dependent enzyme [Gemmatimonadota bacterium]